MSNERKVAIEGNVVAVDEGRNDATGQPEVTYWRFNDPGQVAKHGKHFEEQLGVSKGDIEALTDAANEQRKQLDS